MKRTYSNPWIPEEARAILAKHEGSLLDVGGGASPYYRATHIVDAMPYSEDRLRANAWGDVRSQGSGVRGQKVGESGNKGTDTPQLSSFSPQLSSDTPQLSSFSPQPSPDPPQLSALSFPLSESNYTQLDLCECRQWPFDDNMFDLGLSSHCLEDLRDPLPAVRELSRVCRKILVITPSRLFEQTRGVDHPRYCGFPHHPWMVTARENTLVFRRKTPMLMLPACHLVCPPGKTMKLECGAFYYYGENAYAEEDPIVWTRDYEDYCEFIRPFKGRRDLFVHDDYRHNVKYWVWKFREWVLGQP